MKIRKNSMIPNPASRSARLERRRTLKMAGSAHAYVRGSTVQFYRWLSARGPKSVPQGPSIWICGDCHAGNLGPLASADGALRSSRAQNIIESDKPECIRIVIRRAFSRTWKHLAKERIEDVKPKIPKGERFLAARQAGDQGHRGAIRARTSAPLGYLARIEARR
jgi:Uncharacterized protein conserved in bacteria (DUF2252)